MLLEKNPVEFLDYTFASWTKSKDLSGFDESALAHYRHNYSQQEHIRANCEDYRSGQTYDLRTDEFDREKGNMIRCPLLALWGREGIPKRNQWAARNMARVGNQC